MKHKLLSFIVVLFVCHIAQRGMAQTADPVLLSVAGENISKFGI